MRPTVEVMLPRAQGAVTCPVAAFGIVHAGPELVASLRRNPVPAPGTPLSTSFLKHADEQTVVALAAVYQAIYNHGLERTDFSNWGVVAAPCFPGRAMLAQILKRQALEGAWGVSPHLIPHHSVHAVSGTVSQALHIHGPNFGIGGGPEAIVEALTVAATLGCDRSLPGLWLLMTEHDPEYVPADPDESGSTDQGSDTPLAVALALALVPNQFASMGLTLQICPHAEAPAAGNSGALRGGARGAWTSWPTLNCVSSLAREFSQNGAPTGRWRFGRSGWLELACRPQRGMYQCP